MVEFLILRGGPGAKLIIIATHAYTDTIATKILPFYCT